MGRVVKNQDLIPVETKMSRFLSMYVLMSQILMSGVPMSQSQMTCGEVNPNDFSPTNSI